MISVFNRLSASPAPTKPVILITMTDKPVLYPVKEQNVDKAVFGADCIKICWIFFYPLPMEVTDIP